MYEWTDEEIKILKSNIHLTNKQLLHILPNKSTGSIKYKYTSLKLNKITKFKKFCKHEISKILDSIEFRDRIIGHLLGDGSLNSEISFCLRNTHKDYVDELQAFFNKLTGRNNQISIIPSNIRWFNNVPVKCKESYASTFTCSNIIRPMKAKWYKNSRKIVPKDIILSPLICNRWYCDDGNLYIGKSSLRITLHTDGFQIVDVDFLIGLLKNAIHIKPQKKLRLERTTKQYVIVIRGQDVLSKYIQFYPVDSFKYKWDTKGYQILKGVCKYCKQNFQYSGVVLYRKICSDCIQKGRFQHKDKRLPLFV